jgi:hypothetical protein
VKQSFVTVFQEIKTVDFLTQHEGVIDDSAEEVGRDDYNGPRHVLQEVEHGKLDEHEADDLPFERWVDAKELLNLRIFF